MCLQQRPTGAPPSSLLTPFKEEGPFYRLLERDGAHRRHCTASLSPVLTLSCQSRAKLGYRTVADGNGLFMIGDDDGGRPPVCSHVTPVAFLLLFLCVIYRNVHGGEGYQMIKGRRKILPPPTTAPAQPPPPTFPPSSHPHLLPLQMVSFLNALITHHPAE